jgi:hypothetical protein
VSGEETATSGVIFARLAEADRSFESGAGGWRAKLELEPGDDGYEFEMSTGVNSTILDGTAPALATWHVHFERRSEVALHVCEQHRAIGRTMPCVDATPDGNCAHVQFSRCEHVPRVLCDGCLVAELGAPHH